MICRVISISCNGRQGRSRLGNLRKYDELCMRCAENYIKPFYIRHGCLSMAMAKKLQRFQRKLRVT